MKVLVKGLILTSLVVPQVHGYDVVKRLKVMDDRYKTHDMMNPIGHDFFLDIRAGANTNLLDVIDDADAVSDVQGTELEKLEAATNFLRANDKTEQHLNAKVGLGFPLPSFTVFGLNFKPNFRADWNLAAHLGIFSEPITPETVLSLVDVDLPGALGDAIIAKTRAGDFTGNDDIVKETCDDPTYSASISQFCRAELFDKYFYPDGDAPNIFVMAKQDIKGGFYLDYQQENDGIWFGNFNLYGMHRTDIDARITQGSLVANRDIIDLGDELNSELYLTLDWRVGARHKNYRFYASIEELKLATMSDRKAGSKTPTYGTDALIRAHAEGEFDLRVVDVTPFLGFHKRSGYGVSDGFYLGADWSMHAWEERLGLRLRTQFDREHFTLSPQVKLWLMHLDYMAKIPVKSEIDGIEVATLHSLNFRLFF